MAWAREVIVYSCARSSGNQVAVGLMARNERKMCNYFAQLYLRNGSSKN